MRRSGVVVKVMPAVLLIVALSACAADGTSPLELTGQDSGSRQSLAPGQPLEITLDSNPSTGYRWAIDGTVPPQLEQSGEPQYSSESDLAGGGGTEVWRFTGKSAGMGTLRLKYWRSFEPTAVPDDSFEVSIDVQ